jgi:septin family protein
LAIRFDSTTFEVIVDALFHFGWKLCHCPNHWHSETLARYGRNVLVCGQSGSGKSTLVTGLLERIIDMDTRSVRLIPKATMKTCRAAGDKKQAPPTKQLEETLEEPATHHPDPDRNATVIGFDICSQPPHGTAAAR